MYETSRVFIKSKYELIAIKYKKINKGKHIKISYLYRNKNDRRYQLIRLVVIDVRSFYHEVPCLLFDN